MKKPSSLKKVTVKKKPSRLSRLAVRPTLSRKPLKRLAHHLEGFRSPYVLFALVILIVTCVLWSILGAQLQSNNADQLVNGYLFKDTNTFQNALFPNAHTFLIKWPLFLSLSLYGNANVSLMVMTVLVSLITVAGLVYILYRIDRRAQVLGSLLLALSGVLLLIPAQPYAGGLLPVNFAMLTTRNVEYLVYIVSLVLLIRGSKFKSNAFIGSLVLLSLLVASDRLFLLLSVGGALIMMTIYGLLRQRQFVKLALRWLIVSVGAGIIAMLILWLIDTSNFTNIIGQGDTGPYGFIHSLKQLGLGAIFAIFGMLTNFGANPLFDIGIVKDLPRVLSQRLFEPATFSFLINSAVFVFGIIASVRLFMVNLHKPTKTKSRIKKPIVSTAAMLSLLLVWSSLASIILFVATDHYYAVDARYLTITLFALFISLATYLRSRPLPLPKTLKIVAVGLVAGIVVGSFWMYSTYQQQSAALSNISQRNEKIVQTLKNHKTDLLVGDYWRVMPIVYKNAAPAETIVPLSGCATIRPSLASISRQSTLENHSFTYLLSLDKSLTDYPNCTYDQVVSSFGQPSTSTVITGTKNNPIELLLFYDQGLSRISSKLEDHLLRNIPPIVPLQPVVKPACTAGVTVLNVVAHQDDDLLFMSPDLLHHIDAGHCVRTVYVTAGDAGQNSHYWLGRERGSQEAYSLMLGNKYIVWDEQTVKIADHEYLTVATPRGNTRVTLIFMRLSDGNLRGKGFAASNYESIARLISGRISTIHSVDGQSQYSSDQLTAALLMLMKNFLPTEVNSQAMIDEGRTFHDHSDHLTVGQYMQRAQIEFSTKVHPVPISFYIGYPIREKPENVSGNELNDKIEAFKAYGQFDGAACHLMIVCGHEPTYWAYLHREYTMQQWP